MLNLLLFPLYLFISINESDHAVYISVLEIDSRNMRVKVFSDNLEDAIRNESVSIEVYFQKKIKLQINDQNVNFDLKEVNVKGDSHWITFQLDVSEEWQSFYLEAAYFIELFPDQINVVKVLSDKPRFFRLSKRNTSCSF